MAKTIEQHQADIYKQREKIKTAEQAIKKSEAAIQQIEERELIDLARQIKAAGKLDVAKQLIGQTDQNFAKPATTPDAITESKFEDL
ncbi:hypothetical protein [Trichlorobacter lovleyi]|uniref:hypothetical protein n=1 Tax=Trichlorobacter lovleyi TaxID=313985 RepID=UPI002480BB00|nr:hypothetical protein [Trichlorobacter lovleyi]